MFKISVITIGLLITFGHCLPSRWEFEILEVKTYCSHPELADMKIQAKRISKGEYGISGTVNTSLDLDDNFTISLEIYRKSTKSSVYGLSPWGVRPIKLMYFMNTFYKKYLMNEMRNYTNFPYLENGQFEKIPKGHYYIKDYSGKIENFPPYAPQGFYKGRLVATDGTINMTFIIETQIYPML